MGFMCNGGFSDRANTRSRREDCEFVKHDKLFSKWKVLVGPSDWREGQGAGRNYNIGTGRCYVQNLPAVGFGPGVFELGVTVPSWAPSPQHTTKPLKREDVIPVYIGRAADIRHRLQKFGQAGANLQEPGSRSPNKLYHGDEDSELFCGNGSPTNSWITAQSGGGQGGSAGPRLFSEVLAIGSSIAFRCAHTDSKAVAEQVQAELLVVFDYAWIKGLNGNRRSPDILVKLFMAWPTKDQSNSSWNPVSSSCKRSSPRLFCGRNAVGIKVALRKPQDDHSPTTTTNETMIGNLCFLMTLQPQLKCGVQTAKGSPSNAPPERGREHCLQHHGTKRVTPSGGAQNRAQNIPPQNITTKQFNVDRVGVKVREPVRGVNGYGAGHMRWRLGIFLGRQSCFPRLCRNKEAGNNVKEELQPNSNIVESRRRPCSLSFNTWVKMETDDQRVHNNLDIIELPSVISLHTDVNQEKPGQPANSGRISGIMDPKRRVQRMIA